MDGFASFFKAGFAGDRSPPWLNPETTLPAARDGWRSHVQVALENNFARWWKKPLIWLEKKEWDEKIKREGEKIGESRIILITTILIFIVKFFFLSLKYFYPQVLSQLRGLPNNCLFLYSNLIQFLGVQLTYHCTQSLLIYSWWIWVYLIGFAMVTGIMT